MARKRRPRYEDTGARKCRKMFHAKVEHEYAKLQTISCLRDSADREEFSLDKRGDVMRVEAAQNQEKFHEGSPAAGELNGDINEQVSDTFGEHSHSSSIREEGEESHSSNVREEDEELSLNDRVLCYALYVQHCGFSMEEVRMMEKIWGIIYGKPPPFTYQDTVVPMEKKILAE